MYPKLNLHLALLIFLVNLYIFFIAEILRVAGLSNSSVAWILYNHDLNPIFTWCKQNPYLTNLVLFIFTVIVYEGSYFGYFYIERKILKC
jgi:nicotinamide riboside transporter PnuC